MKITKIDGFQCTCEARGVEREVSLFMMQGEDLEPARRYPTRKPRNRGRCSTRYWPPPTADPIPGAEHV
jgi:hypothetical protein